MAARKLRKQHQDDIKQKIQASQLVNRLQDHVFGKIEMSKTQVSAAKVLLDKVLSNAPQVLDATVDGSLTIEIVRFANPNSK